MKQMCSDMQLGMLCTIYREKIKKKNHTFEKELCCTKQLLKESNEDPGTAEEWTDRVDRGGLWHVKETTYQVFCALEEET